jgi:hypothetical protein
MISVANDFLCCKDTENCYIKLFAGKLNSPLVPAAQAVGTADRVGLGSILSHY